MKKGEIKANNIIGFGLLFLVGLMVYQTGGFQAITGGDIPDQQPINVIVEGACGVDSTTLTVNLEKKYSQATDMSAENATIVINGAEVATKSDGSSVTVSPGNKLDIYHAFVSSTYYTSKASGTIPCEGAIYTSTSNGWLKPADSYKVIQMEANTGSSLFSVVNNDGTTTNFPGGTTAQAIAAGQTKKYTITFTPTFEDGFGVDGNVFSCQYNTTAYDNENPLRLTASGANLPSAANPSNTLWTALTTDHSKMSWALPSFDGGVISEYKMELFTKADGNYNPNAGGGNVTCQMFDTDYFKTDSGEFKTGIEDSDDNSDVGLTNTVASYGMDLLVS